VEALQHNWFSKLKTPQMHSEIDVVNRIMQFKGVSQFKRAALNLLVKTISAEEVMHLRDVFEKID
jgi:hypothetical protein